MSESYLHFHAKMDLASWLRKMKGKSFKGLNNITLKWKGKGKSPMFDVYTEYPVCKDKTTNKLIGYEITWEDYFKVASNDMKPKKKHGIPEKWELKNWEDRLIILHIFDVVVMDDNKISHIFEIKHTHAVDKKKIRFVEKRDIPMWEVSAQWVIEKCVGKIPWDLEFIQNFCVLDVGVAVGVANNTTNDKSRTNNSAHSGNKSADLN